MKKSPKKKSGYGLITILIAIALYIGNVYVNGGDWFEGINLQDIFDAINPPQTSQAPPASQTPQGTAKTLSVHFIDVGQGDCGLVIGQDFTMLIDAGTSSSYNKISSYLRSQKVTSIDYLIGTHPHEDHIGSMDDVIDNFDIKKVYIPNAQASTKTYLNLLNSIKNKGLNITQPKAGSLILSEDDLAIKILAPISQSYEDLNNYSIVVKVLYGQTSFLFTGDAEQLSEQEMVKKFPSDLKSTVLKVGHHGSSSSTTASFLKAVSPKYAVISLGKNNTYNHPHREVMQRLQNFLPSIEIYQTAEVGDIVITSDGKNLKVNK